VTRIAGRTGGGQQELCCQWRGRDFALETLRGPGGVATARDERRQSAEDKKREARATRVFLVGHAKNSAGLRQLALSVCRRQG
jgi:hypothetical protein